jgi:cytochrome bd ubiquinol oxidase subunit II
VETIWFALLCFLMIVYVVLDGFDFGVGIVHMIVAKTDEERTTVLSAIGPVWNGNEVWLVAFGGALVFAFPPVYATAMSGFYLPLMLVLWLLIGRGVAIEFRSHLPNPLWRAFWDVAFALSSGVMALVLGAVLGNLLRGVPLGPGGAFHVPFFTDFLPGPDAGALDWYTVLVGGFAAVVLAAHGALFVAYKTVGPVQARSARLAHLLWSAAAAAVVPTTYATAAVDPELFARLWQRPVAWPLPLCILGSLIVLFASVRNGRDRRAFFASSAFIASMLAATAVGVYPDLLKSNVGEAYSLTAQNAAAGRAGLAAGLIWFVPALALAVTYVAYAFRSVRGKVRAGDGAYQ